MIFRMTRKKITRELFDKKSDKAKYDNYEKCYEDLVNAERCYLYEKSQKEELQKKCNTLEKEKEMLDRKIKYKDSPNIDITVKSSDIKFHCNDCDVYGTDCSMCEDYSEIDLIQHVICKHFEIVKEDDKRARIDIVDDSFDKYSIFGLISVYDMKHDCFLYDEERNDEECE